MIVTSKSVLTVLMVGISTQALENKYTGTSSCIVYSFFMPVCSIVKTITPRFAVDDLKHYCTRPSASCNSASGRPRYRGVIV